MDDALSSRIGIWLGSEGRGVECFGRTGVTGATSGLGFAKAISSTRTPQGEHAYL